MEKTKKIKLLVSFVFVVVFSTILPVVVNAATLHFSPSSGTHTIGSAFSVSVYVSSTDQMMNAASGVISFPKDKLEVTSLSQTGSIFTLWVQKPSFSNLTGTVNFEGIALNPGWTGASGKLITMNFKVKAAGTAFLKFNSGSVLANDGKGTDILASFGNASFSLGDAYLTVPRATTPSEVVGTPTAPQVSSSTYPDQNKWYATNDAKFAWSVPLDVTATRLLVDRIPQAVPTVYYHLAINSKEVPDLSDGVWYFHVRLRNTSGWGGVSHFRFQIDTKKPTRFDIREVEREDKTNPKVKFVFDAEDDTSGIDHYEVQIDDGSPQVWHDDGSGVFETPVLGPGKHTLIAKAIDKAGNSRANSAEFLIEALESPTIINYPKKLTSGEILVIKGTTYSNAKAVVWLQREKDEPQSQIVKSDDNGNFTFVAEGKLKEGIYKLWVEAIDERGAMSKPTEKVTIVVEQSTILKIGNRAITILNIIIPLVALIILLLVIIWYVWHKLFLFKRRIRKETKKTEKALHRAFKLLKEETEEQVLKMDGKPDLSRREKKIYGSLKKALKDSEKFIGKDIKDIEKEVE